MKEYDLVVIGSGVGLTIIEAGLRRGLKCALIENSKFGGTCLTRGCIPSKVLVYPADLIREIQRSGKVGVSAAHNGIRWDLISSRMWSQIHESDHIEHSLMNVPNLTVYKGTGEFTGDHILRVHFPDKSGGKYSEEFRGKKIVIAAGARPLIPPVKGLDEVGYVDYTTFFGSKFPNKPYKSLTIIGGGAIGAEFAHIFSAFGTKVNIVEMKPHLVPLEEEEISSFLEKQFIKNGISVFTGYRVISASKDKNSSMKVLILQEISTGAEKRIESEEIFVAAGLKSNADILKVQNTGVKTDSAGWIITNEYLETSAPDIWALGDINGRFQFRHKANYEAEICVHNLFGSEHGHGHKYAVSYRAVPWAIYTHPQIAHLGLTAREVKQHGIPYLVGRNRYSSVAAGFSMGYSNGDDDDGFVKLITDGEWKILGVHIIGPQAAVLLQPFVYLMNAGLSCKPQTLQAKMHDHSRTVGAGGEEAHNHSGSDVHIHEAVVKCRGGGSIIPLFQSMVIHPSLSEVAAWVTGRMEWGE